MRVLSADLVARVAQFLHRYSTLNERLTMGIAVSGGADSIVLLHIMSRLVRQAGARAVVLHVNHGLRGSDSDADETFVREVAASLHWPIAVHSGHPRPGNLEAEARRVRQAFFQQARQELGLGYVALGHTASDQAETVLFRLLRGSGLAGLGGMQPVTALRLIRPLLTTTRAEVRAFAEAHGIVWREDISNQNLGYRRNRLRLETIPYLQQHFNERLERVLTGMADTARSEESYWRRRIEKRFQQLVSFGAAGELYLSTSRLAALPKAEQRRLLRRAIQEVRGHLRGIDFEHAEAALAVATSRIGHDRVQLPGVDVLRSFETLRIANPLALTGARDYRLPLELGQTLILPFRAGQISVNPVTAPLENCVTVKHEAVCLTGEADVDGDEFDKAAANASLQVRNWQPGDSFVRPGSAEVVKIKTLFQEYRVLIWERRHWPILIAGTQIVWTRRFGPAKTFAASQASSRRYRIQFRSADRNGEL